MPNTSKHTIDIPVTAPIPRQALRHGEDAFAMVNRHHEEYKEMRRRMRQQGGR